MNLKSTLTLVLAAALAVGMVGCKKKMDRVTPLPGYGAGQTIRDLPGDGSGTRTTINGLPGENGTRPGGTGMIEQNPPRNPNDLVPLSGNRSIEGRPQDRERFRSQMVFFDFDRHNVKASEARKVQQVADEFKRENPATDLLIEGHCDERGTEGYNQSLGEKRALALREMLVTLGVPADRIHTASFGKDRPLDPGHNDAAYAKNRRGEFILVQPK